MRAAALPFTPRPIPWTRRTGPRSFGRKCWYSIVRTIVRKIFPPKPNLGSSHLIKDWLMGSFELKEGLHQMSGKKNTLPKTSNWVSVILQRARF